MMVAQNMNYNNMWMNEYVSMVLELCVNILSIIVTKQNLVSTCWSLVLHTSGLILLATTFLIHIESHGYCIYFRNKKDHSWKNNWLVRLEGSTVAQALPLHLPRFEREMYTWKTIASFNVFQPYINYDRRKKITVKSSSMWKWAWKLSLTE